MHAIVVSGFIVLGLQLYIMLWITSLLSKCDQMTWY